jgi:dipeptidyl aminopeptidase/acylaminoacyl peptidase
MFTSSDWSRDPRSRAKMKQIVGDPEKGLKELEAVSPDYLYRKLQRPLLLVHGGSDRRVTPEHALRLLLMLGKAERPPQLLFFGAEGHGIVDISARFALEAAGERFLSECLRTDTANAQ